MISYIFHLFYKHDNFINVSAICYGFDTYSDDAVTCYDCLIKITLELNIASNLKQDSDGDFKRQLQYIPIINKTIRPRDAGLAFTNL